jgi:hypothetical protein
MLVNALFELAFEVRGETLICGALIISLSLLVVPRWLPGRVTSPARYPSYEFMAVHVLLTQDIRVPLFTITLNIIVVRDFVATVPM